MEILDGKGLAKVIKEELAGQTETFVANGQRPPHLAAVLVGENPASQSYVRNKIRSCEKAGIKSSLIKLEESISQQALLDVVHDLNNQEDLDGFIVQLPLPDHIDEQEINLAIDYRKDVDGFHPVNFGRMVQGLDAFLPATPMGILEMLKRYKIETSGKHAVVIGRSNIVGKPISILLSRKADPGNATVTLAHSRTADLGGLLRQADIIIAAIGIANFVKADMVKEGAVVIDVGINRVPDSSKKSGSRLVGDVDFEAVSPKCSYITPVPGGVGPMTVSSLLMNTIRAYKKEVYPE
ncbi:MAG: bifunctional methylenetetrahydrofolate dehydrogenase/methenyltetrahydrofolate cyclohydrolase FolD [Saprospiraceae bacterium]|nr:bifunctional methylenetetrahydrofolate dehydrogenase/methenyltetrahydrofolate cyclohydrolase FolD [Saprospiraceae bacterium]